jgi:4-hydroxybenzoate polyprenyltransferase
MNHLKLFIELTRLKKPIGYMLLFWPCAWGLTLAYDFSNDLSMYYFYLMLFFLGAILMRSAGCIVNDIADKEFDKKVIRTKNRPIAFRKNFNQSCYTICCNFMLISFKRTIEL